MNYSLATIVNAHGSMADLPGDAMVILPDQFEDVALVQSLEALWQEPPRRTALGARAREIIEVHHQPEACVAQYAHAIERFYQPAAPGVPGLLAAIAQASPRLGASEWPAVANAVARNHAPSPRARRLFVDISELVQRDARSGIQRVVRNILREWLAAPPSGYQLEPVYAVADQPGYRCASRFVSGFMGLPQDWAVDEWIDAYPGDVFLGLDLQPLIVPAQADVLLDLKNRGIGVYFVVYDLLPLLMPQAFPSEGQALFQRWLDTVTCFDGVACISSSVASALTDWLAAHPPATPHPFHVGWFHLGAEIQPIPGRSAAEAPPDPMALLPQLGSGPGFLMVGTIEPRKGHAQTLAAFESLWREALDVQLILVGKQGWMVEALVEQLRHHPERGRRLHWLETIGDEALDQLYGKASCLIAASEGEGFGLPLIEAAQHCLPILARDLPVFREVAGDHATYFSGAGPEDLAGPVRAWLQLYQQGRQPRSDGMGWLTWRQSADALARCLPLEEG
jgi:glycosyltransferase involved in cell wall biosynthesis